MDIYKDNKKINEVLAFKNDLDPSCDDAKIVDEYIKNCVNEYEEKRKILYRAICDFISGMTDSYATDEYRKLLC